MLTNGWRRLALLVCVAIPAVVLAVGNHGYIHTDRYFANKTMVCSTYVDADSARDAIANITITERAYDYRALYLRCIVADGSEGEIADNEDTVRVYLISRLPGMGYDRYIDSAKSDELPDTVTFDRPYVDADGGALTDTTWGAHLILMVKVDSDTTEDTSFVEYYPITAEWVLK